MHRRGGREIWRGRGRGIRKTSQNVDKEKERKRSVRQGVLLHAVGLHNVNQIRKITIDYFRR